jgi:hypothetical protein
LIARRLLFVLGGLLVSTVGSFALLCAPRVWAPAPLFFFAMALILQSLVPIGPYNLAWISVLILAFYLATGIPTLKARAGLPRFTVILFILLSALSIAHLAFSYRDGLNYQGPLYTTVLGLLNLTAIALLAMLAFRLRARESTSSAMVFHFLVILWLSWFAFPWFGEMP